MAFPADYTLLGDFEFPAVTGAQTDFVALLRYDDFTTNMLASIDDGGGDLRFSTDAAGTSQLPCEVVEFDKVGNSVQVWVKITSASTSQKFYVWGNNPGDSQPPVTDTYGRNAVWSDFAAVLHLVEFDDGSSNVFVDSTGNGRAGNMLSGVSTQVSGSPTGGFWQQFDGTNDTAEIINTGSLLDGQNFTLSVWCSNDGTTGTFDEGILSNRTTPSQDNSFLMSEDNGGIAAHVGATYQKGSAGLVGTTMRRSLINNQTSWWSRINGEANVTNNSGAISASTNIMLGWYLDSNTNRRWDGKFGEVWIRLADISFDRDLTEYQNQSAVGAYFIATDAPIGSTSIPVIMNAYRQRRV